MSAITIPEGFFPPPGVPLSSNKQRDLAILLHNSGCLKLQLNTGERWADEDQWTPGFAGFQYYRLAPPKPRTVGPFESVHEVGATFSNYALVVAQNAASEAGFAKFRIKLTATAEEIL